MLYRSATHF